MEIAIRRTRVVETMPWVPLNCCPTIRKPPEITALEAVDLYMRKPMLEMQGIGEFFVRVDVIGRSIN